MCNEKVYIIILNYNNYSDTIECIESVLNLSYCLFKIIVVDNASTDGSGAFLERYFLEKEYCNIIYIKSEYNGGYAYGNNLGIKYVLEKNDSDFIWILNNDTTVEKNSLTYLVKKCINNKKIGMCCSKLIYSWDKNIIQGYGGKYNYFLGIDSRVTNADRICEMDYVIGASLFIPTKIFRECGLLNEEYFLYFEELDFSERLRGKYMLDCATDSIVYHKEGASIGSDSISPNSRSIFSEYYYVKNKIIFTKKYYKKFLPTIYLGIIMMILNRIRRGHMNKAVVILKVLLGIKIDEYEKH